MNPTAEDMTAKKPKSIQVMDIAKPGTLKNAAAGSRPVIVGNRVVVQDPMVNASPTVDKPASHTREVGSEGDAKADAKPNPDEGIARSEKKVIKPLTLSDPVEESPKAATESDKTADDAVQADKEDKDALKTAAKEGLLDAGFDTDADGVIEDGETKPVAEPEKSKAAPSEAPSTPKSDDSDKPAAESENDAKSETDGKPASDNADLDKVSAKEEADAKAQEELDSLVEEKTYFLPINAAQHRRSRIFAIIGIVLILVLALAWVNVALDAGIITVPGIKPLTHFFGS